MTTLCVIAVAATLVFTMRAESAPKERPNRTIGYGQIRFQGLGPERWAMRYRLSQSALKWARQEIRTLRAQLKRERRMVLTRPNVAEAINLAGAVYGHTETLWRKARCESVLDPNAHNASGASGLFQFLPSTWRSTPYGGLSIWSPYANAMAAGWMHAHGRGGEWVCR